MWPSHPAITAINIVSEDVAASTHLNGGVLPAFKPMPLKTKNSGHAFQAEPASGAPKSYSKIRGDEFSFVQVHWHAPSEHTIDGKHLAALKRHLDYMLIRQADRRCLWVRRSYEDVHRQKIEEGTLVPILYTEMGFQTGFL